MNRTEPNAHAAPHRRHNALTGDWVLVSPHRLTRPWQGQVERAPPSGVPDYDPACYLCPGNPRAGGERNPAYTHTHVFTNDFPALLPDPPVEAASGELLRRADVRGTCRVLCFSPRHDLTLAQMGEADVRRVIDLWADQTVELGRRYSWVQVFENKGEAMGCSNPHPHGQVWALDALPTEVAKEDAAQRRHFQRHGQVLLLAYEDLERGRGERVVLGNEHWTVVVPYWAAWPFETLILPRRHVLRLPDLTDDERNALADVTRRLLVRYDNVFETSFPYSMGWHGAPYGPADWNHWQLHAHVFPPLLRSATVRKFMVGFELLGETQRDLTPEQAAERLRSLPDVHYLSRSGGSRAP